MIRRLGSKKTLSCTEFRVRQDHFTPQEVRLLAVFFFKTFTDSLAPHCTTSYAITLEGARRALYEIGYDHLNKAIDLEYSRLAYEGMTPGLIVHPPLMAQWKTGTEKDSDIPRNQSWKPESHGGTSGPQVRQSIRKSLRDLTYGVEEVVKEEEQEQEPLAA